MELEEMKREYDVLAKKYGLSSFKDLNNDFEIEKLDKKSDTLLRAIRKLMMDKIVNSITFLEMLVNPINAPRMYLPYIRAMSVEDRKTIDDIYNVLAELSLLSLDLEIDSNEKGEAELIKKVCDKWNSLKPGFKDILKNIKQPKSQNNNKRERSYFG